MKTEKQNPGWKKGNIMLNIEQNPEQNIEPNIGQNIYQNTEEEKLDEKTDDNTQRSGVDIIKRNSDTQNVENNKDTL